MYGATGAKAKPITNYLDSLSSKDIRSRLSEPVMASTVDPIDREAEELVDNPFIIDVLDDNDFISYKMREDLDGFFVDDYEEPLRDISQEVPQIMSVDPEDRAKVEAKIAENKEKFRKFLLTEIAPLELSFDIATNEVSQELGLILDTEVSDTFKAVREMMTNAINIKVMNFFSTMLGLGADYERLVVQTCLDRLGAGNKQKSNQNPEIDAFVTALRKMYAGSDK